MLTWLITKLLRYLLGKMKTQIKGYFWWSSWIHWHIPCLRIFLQRREVELISLKTFLCKINRIHVSSCTSDIFNNVIIYYNGFVLKHLEIVISVCLWVTWSWTIELLKELINFLLGLNRMLNMSVEINFGSLNTAESLIIIFLISSWLSNQTCFFIKREKELFRWNNFPKHEKHFGETSARNWDF